MLAALVLLLGLALLVGWEVLCLGDQRDARGFAPLPHTRCRTCWWVRTTSLLCTLSHP